MIATQNFNTLKSIQVTAVASALAVLAACGGGGAASTTPPAEVIVTPPVIADVNIFPASADMFPDVPVEFTITGGTSPFNLSSTNATIVPVAGVTISSSNKFSLVARNVVADTPVTITVRDSTTPTLKTKDLVATVRPAALNNTVVFTPLAPTGNGCGTNGLCSGGDAEVRVTAVLNGQPLANRQIRFSVFFGQFGFVTPGTGTLVSTLTVATDELGIATARVRADVSAPTQVATLTSTDVSTNLTRQVNFNVVQQTSGTNIITTLPGGTVTFTGARGPTAPAGQTAIEGFCPIGSVDYYIFGGTPPYRIVTPLPSLVQINPGTVNVNGGSFTATINGCGTTQAVVTDATNRTVSTADIVGVRGAAGDVATAPPAPTAAVAVTATPTPLPFTACNQTGTVNLGGTGNFTGTISTPGMSNFFALSPSAGTLPATVSITRNGVTGPTAFPTPIQVTFANSAGSAIVVLTAVAPGDNDCL